MNHLEQLEIELQDTEWPYTYFDHDRTIARAIVVDDAENYYFAQITRDDDFGQATLIETSGGGVEPEEDLYTAVKRELLEELGAEVEVLSKIGIVRDAYNLIHRRNINHYFLCHLKRFGKSSQTTEEINDFHLTTLRLSYAEAVLEYQKRACMPLGRLIANRELPVLRRAKEILGNT